MATCSKKVSELPILTSPLLSGVTIVVQDGVTYETSLESLLPLFSGGTGSSGTSGTSGESGSSGTSGSDDALALTAVADAGQYTGFKNGSDLHISYDWTGRTITLTGTTIEYYWKGVKHTLTSPWTSPSHLASNQTWFLFSNDGDNFIWQAQPWSFDQLQVAAVYRRPTQELSFGLRESHELMDVDSHEEFHKMVGTYRDSGFGIIYTGNTPTDAANSPYFQGGIVIDEDLKTTISAWVGSPYTIMYITTGLTRNIFQINSLLPFSASTDTNLLLVNNPNNGQMTDALDEHYYNVYQIIIPVAQDEYSQQFRMSFLQPQINHTSLASAQAENPKALSFGSLSSLAPEYLIYTRITYHVSTGYTNTGRCEIAGVSHAPGTRATQTPDTSTNIGVTIANPAEGRILTSDDSGSVANAQTKLTFDGITFKVSGTTYNFTIDPDSLNVREGELDRTIFGPGYITLTDNGINAGYITSKYIDIENYDDYAFIGAIGSDGSEYWFQTNAYDSAVDPHDGPALTVKDGNYVYATIFGV